MTEMFGQKIACAMCGEFGTGNYCCKCGQPYQIKRITLSELFHDIFHFFTHLDKGFGYTLKLLVTSPGTMQRLFIEGRRSKYQKPFSMFFICVTFAALSRYWIFSTLFKYYNVGETAEADFYHEYMALLQLALMPLYIFVSWIFFLRSKYNYAEIGVLLLYTLSFFCLSSVLISLLKFIWPNLDTAYIELPFFVIYNGITFVNFFNGDSKSLVALKSILIIVLIFFLIQIVENYLMAIL